MMIQEFEKLTGFHPTADLYEAIEHAYMEFDGDKIAFCKAYKTNKNGLAEKIQRRADTARFKKQNTAEKDVKALEEKITKLEAALEREEEWKPYVDGHNYQQDRYDELKKSGRVMTDEGAKDLLYDEFGFARERIKIHHSVPTYEVNRHRQLREVGQAERLPLYDATDWNYIRFDCCGWCYEMINGQLSPFMH